MKHEHSHAKYVVKRHRKGHRVTMHAVDGTKDKMHYETRADAKIGRAHV